MNMNAVKNYWKYYAWEALPALLMSFTLIITFAQGFYIPESAANNIPLALVFSACVLAYCFAGNYNKRTMLIFSVLYVVITALLLLLMRAGGIDIVDESGSDTSIYIYYIAAFLIPAIVFVLTRTRPGTAVLFLAGIYLYGLNAFLKFDTKPWCLVIFVVSAIILYLLRQYRIMAIKNRTVDPEFTNFAKSTAATVLAGLLIGILIFVAVIRPLAPPTADLKLIEKYMSYQVLEMIGITQQYKTPDQNSQSNNTNEQQQNTNQQEQNDEQTNDDTQATEGNELERPDSGASQDETPLSSISFEKRLLFLIIMIIVLAVAAAVSAFLIRRYMRKRKMKELGTGTYKDQVINTYRYLLTRFAKIGFKRPDHYTEIEYADSCYKRLGPYLRGAADIDEITDMYLEARYTKDDVPAESASKISGVYPALLENYKRLHGKLRYLLKYFSL